MRWDETVHDMNHPQRVSEAPSFVHSLSAESRDGGYIELTPGGAATLSCRAVGRPRPEVRWYKDDRRLPAHDDGWIVVLDDVTRQHGGRYTCHVTNGLGSVSRTYVVHVAGTCGRGSRYLLI